MARHFLGTLIAALAAWLALAQGPAPVADGDERLLQSAGIQPTGPALLEFIRGRTVGEERVAQVPRLVGQLGHPDFATREQACQELIMVGKVALPALEAAARHADLEIALRARRLVEAITGQDDRAVVLAALRMLTRRQPPGSVEVLLGYLGGAGDARLEEEIAACLAILGVKDGQVDPLLARAWHRDRPAQRLASAAAFCSAGPRQREAARQFLADPSPRVRWHTARLLLADHDRAAVPTLIELVGEGPPELARQADDLLGRIAGPHIPSVGLGAGDAASRQKCHDAWWVWWRLRGPEVNLAKLNLKLDADAELAMLVDQAVRMIRETLNSKEDRLKAERGRTYAVLIAIYAQTGTGGASTPARATLRDAALRLGRELRDNKFSEARRQLEALATLNPDRQAAPGSVAVFKNDVGIDEVMITFGSARRGGLDTERTLTNLEKEWKREARLPESLLNDDLIRQAAHAARVAEAIQEQQVGKQQKEWLTKAEDMRQAAGKLNAAVRAKDGQETYRAIRLLNERCNNCHDTFRQ